MSDIDSLPSTFQYVLRVRPDRSISDDNWEEIDAAHLEAWRTAASLLKLWTYEPNGRVLNVSADWQPLLNRMRQMHQWHVNLYAAVACKAEPDLRVPMRPATVPLRASIEGDRTESNMEHIARHHIESFIYDVFLMLNIASAGSCNFYHATMRARSHTGRVPRTGGSFELSEYSFDLANLDGHEGKWPAPRTLPLERVISWYKRVRVGATQVPSNSMEKVLFALMHLARTEVSVNTVVWLFYGLETFFDTRPGENFRTLVSRICLWLAPTDHQKALLRKSLRALYDIRSSFVHGGREVIHPLHNEAADPRIEDQYRELMTTTEFGFAVLLAAVQEAARRGWAEIAFSETVSGS